MRILYHHRTQSEDAQGIHIHEMVKAFRDLGHQVNMVALVERDEGNGQKTRGAAFAPIMAWIPCWLYEIMSLGYNLYGYLRLRREIRSNPPDLIYERYSLNTFSGVWASRRFGIPLVLEVNSPLYLEQSQFGKLAFRRIARFTERWICSHATRTVVVSGVMKEILAREGVPRENMVVMTNGVDPERFNPTISGRAVRERYGLEGNLVVGFVGWFREWHALEILLKAVHDARLNRWGVRVLLVGEGPAYPNLYRYAERLDLLPDVIFTGPVKREEVASYIAAMDITVQPAATEYACPMKIFEYMGMRKCIVAPDQPNIREILDDAVNAALFRAGDKESLEAVLMELVMNPRKREELGQRAYETLVARGLLWRSNAERILRLVFGEVEGHAREASDDRRGGICAHLGSGPSDLGALREGSGV